MAAKPFACPGDREVVETNSPPLLQLFAWLEISFVFLLGEVPSKNALFILI
jgi:hypothetical protein